MCQEVSGIVELCSPGVQALRDEFPESLASDVIGLQGEVGNV